MDTKTKGHGSLSRLTPEQRQQVDEWLFEGNATYCEVVKRCAKAFGVTITKSSVARHYQREYGTRIVDQYARRIHEQDALLKALEAKPNVGSGYRLALRLIEQLVAEEAFKPANKRDYRKVAYLTRVMTGARRECNDYSRAFLLREKFEFSAATECLLHNIEMQALEADKSMDDGDRILKIREMLFGPNLPK